jgi:hypothetical protein
MRSATQYAIAKAYLANPVIVGNIIAQLKACSFFDVIHGLPTTDFLSTDDMSQTCPDSCIEYHSRAYIVVGPFAEIS